MSDSDYPRFLRDLLASCPEAGGGVHPWLFKAAGKADQRSARLNGSQPHKKVPLKDHPQYCVYFRLAAENELDPRLFAAIERSAKSMIQHALEVGIEEP